MIQPIVSICCITFNHENYIRDAIEGFLMQKTSFPIEIIIHDDASTDKTALIIKEYANKHPYIILPIFQTTNQYSQGIKPWPNYVFPITRGKYIALCEGDDYWTDPLKLQKQVDVMENNHNLAGCAHGCSIMYEMNNNNIREFLYKKLRHIDVSTFLSKNIFTATASIIFKKSILKNLPPFSEEIFAGDFVLKYTILSVGNIGYIPVNMCVYRKGSIGSWSNRKISHKIVNKEYLDNLRVLYYFDEITNSKYHKDVLWKTKKLVASYLFQTVVFNSLWINIKNFVYACPYLSFRVNGAFLKSIIKSISKE